MDSPPRTGVAVLRCARRPPRSADRNQFRQADKILARDCLGQITKPLSSPLRKNILIFRNRKSLYNHRHPVLPKGRWPSSRTLGRDAVDARCAKDEGAFLRTAKSCGPDASTLASSSREASFPGVTVTKKPI